MPTNIWSYMLALLLLHSTMIAMIIVLCCLCMTQRQRHVRELMRVLLSAKPNTQTPPTAATPVEQRQWRINISMNTLLNESNLVVIDESNQPTQLSKDVPTTFLNIIKHTMVQVCVKFYRPMWSSSSDNQYNELLLRLAVVILIKLVRAGEFTGVTHEEVQPSHLKNLFINHLKGTWLRK